MKYQTITDVIEYEVKPALGEWVQNFDDDALHCIADECFEYRDGEFIGARWRGFLGHRGEVRH